MSPKTKISVITVNLNDEIGLAKTINSVADQTYENIEYILVDGNSVDKSIEIIQKNKDVIDRLLIEQDVGIYHAMNKGISLATGEWLLFMNAGDVFASSDALGKALEYVNDNIDVIYSDWIYSYSKRLVKADIKKLNVRHQSVIYRKSLHEMYGNYVVGKRVSISDYIFFLSIFHKYWQYSPTIISICDETGISSAPPHFFQRIASELIFGKRSRLNAALILIAYPFYRFAKRTMKSLIR
jgi:glycosyltransferase involved in cell wall biosynthesis